jgi:hypothetical protein
MNSLPAQLEELPQWVPWKHQERSNNRTGKMPVSALTGRACDIRNPENWLYYRDALSMLETGRFDGIGIVTPQGGDLCGIDLDRALEYGLLRPGAQSVLDCLSTYAELSPSCTGLHLYALHQPLFSLGKHTLPCGTGIEFIPRYFTVTGARLPTTPFLLKRLNDDALSALKALLPSRPLTEPAAAVVGHWQEFSDWDLLAKMKKANNSANFLRLWQGSWQGRYLSPSEADLALCRHLAWWFIRVTPSEELPARIDRLFRSSALCRDKWEQRPDYRDNTIAKAVAHCICNGTGYEPGQRRKPAVKPRPRDVAKDWLCALLADGPVRSTEVLRLAAEEGIAERTLKRSKPDIVRSVQTSENVNWWALTEETEPHKKRVQDNLHQSIPEPECHIAHKYTGGSGGRTAEHRTPGSAGCVDVLAPYHQLYAEAKGGQIPFELVVLPAGLQTYDPAESILYHYVAAKRCRKPESQKEHIGILSALFAWWSGVSRA